MPHAPEAMSAQREHLLFRTYKVDRNDWTGPISTVHHVNNVNNQNNSNNNGSHSDLGTTLPWDSLFKNITFVETIRTTPDLQLWIFIVAAICLGIVFNLLVLRSILRAKCNGTVYLLMQIAVADLISLTQIKYELFYVSNRSWLDPPEMCGVYLGLDTFTNTAIVFFIVALNFHTISTYNLAQKTIARNAVKLMAEDVDCEISGAAVNDENDDDDDADDEDESNEKMVTRNQHHQRSIVIDYSKPKSYVSVQMPVIFIWLLAASMSVPLFWYGDILPSGCNGAKICGVIQYTRSNTVLLQFLLIKMRIVVPSACLAFSTIYVMATLLKGKRILSRPCGLDEDVRQILKLAAALSLTFILCSMQRLYGSLWFELISRPMMERKYAAFDKWIGIGGCMLHYAAPIVRPVIYCLFAPNVSMKCTVFCCSCCRRR